MTNIQLSFCGVIHRRYRFSTQKVGTRRAGLAIWFVGTKWRIDMPMRGELPTRAARTYVVPSVTTAWLRVVTAVSDPELRTIIAICTIGILVTLNMALRFPDFGGLVADLECFP